MRRIGTFVLLLALIVGSLAQNNEGTIASNIVNGFLQLMQGFLNPVFTMTKVTNDQSHTETVTYTKEENTQNHPENPTLVELQKNEHANENADMKNINSDDINSAPVTTKKQRHYLKKSPEVVKKFNLFHNSGDQGKIFKKLDGKTLIAIQSKTQQEGEAQNTEETPSNQAEAALDDTETADAITAMTNQIREDVQKVSKDLKKDLESNNEKLAKQLNHATQEMKEEVKQSEERITKAVKEEASKLNEEVKKSAESIKEEVHKVGDKVDENLIQTLKLRKLTLEDQLENKEKELEELKTEINKLREELPPPQSICDTLFDCESCTANAQCGWCIAEQKCVQGDKVGPLYETCNFYDFGMCSGGGCARYKDCGVIIFANFLNYLELSH